MLPSTLPPPKVDSVTHRGLFKLLSSALQQLTPSRMSERFVADKMCHTASTARGGYAPAVPLKLKNEPVAKCTNCSHLQWKLSEIS